MAKLSFSATVGDFAKKVPEALNAVFQESAQDLVKELNDQLQSMVYDKPESPNYRRTRFLQSSLMASTSGMPRANLSNPGAPATPDFGTVELVISDAEMGDTLYLGYTANYGPYVHYGSNGSAPRPWVTLTAQRWQEIVNRNAKKVKQAFGL